MTQNSTCRLPRKTEFIKLRSLTRDIAAARVRHVPLGGISQMSLCAPRKGGARERSSDVARFYFFTVLAGALAGVAGFFDAGLALALSAAVLMSSISLVTREALLPRSLSK